VIRLGDIVFNAGAATSAALALAACTRTDLAAQMLPPVELYGSAICGAIREPDAQWIDDEAAWRIMFARVTSGRSGAELPAVDFGRSGVLVVAMGTRSSGGYSLALAPEPAELTGRTLTVRVEWQEPPSDAMVTLALTNPCVLIELPRGAYERIEVIDQDARQRAVVSP